jgi:secreted trypsin-like serine protease
MTANKLIRDPLWVILPAALVAAMVSLFVFVQSGETAPQATADNQSTKITGGKAVPNGKYPFMVALLDKRTPGNAFQEQFCGGTLIDKDSVLTAAHCFFDAKGDPDPESIKVLKVIVGRTVLTTRQGQVRSVKRKFIHPKYNPNSAAFGNYDAAVLKVSRSVSGIAPIKLASSKQNILERPGRKATVAGWGSTTARRACVPSPLHQPVFPERMREAQVPIVSDSRADQLYKDICQFSGGLRSTYTPQLMVAAGGTGKDTCQADSGGPLFVAQASSARYTQIGITSFGPGCGPERYPTAYTEVNASQIASFIGRAAK